MTQDDFDMILEQWGTKYPYRVFRDTASHALLVIAAAEFQELCQAIRTKLEPPEQPKGGASGD